MPKRGHIQRAVIAALFREHQRDIIELTCNVFETDAEALTKDQIGTVRRAVKTLVDQNLVAQSPYPSIDGRVAWKWKGPIGREQSQRIKGKSRLRVVS
jgi:hypothetical protein